MVILLITGYDWPADVKAKLGSQHGRPRKADNYIRNTSATAT
jgi:hypothetical protein